MSSRPRGSDVARGTPPVVTSRLRGFSELIVGITAAATTDLNSSAFSRTDRNGRPCLPRRRSRASGGGRTRRDAADQYEASLRAEGIPTLERTALGTQLFREDREEETWFVAVSYWPSMEAMTAFTKGEPTKVHHLDRDPDFLIELPDRVEIYRILVDRQGLR